MREEMRTFGYLCPQCGKTVMRARSVFALEASGTEVDCGCGGSALTVSFDGERYRLTVPCGLCGGTHTAVCSRPQMLEGGGTALACAETKQFCCFIGPEGTVERQLRELAILAEKQRRQGENETFVDNVIMYEVLSELRDIAARGGISCACGSAGCSLEVHGAAVDLICPACGGRLRLPAAADGDLDRLCCQYTLVIPGKKYPPPESGGSC